MSQIVTRPLEDFFPMILSNATGCPEPLAEQELRLAAVEFCERTRCWRQIIRRQLTRADLNMVAPVYATIHEIETASWNGIPLDPVQFSMVQNDLEGDTDTGIPAYITQDNPGSVTLFPFSPGLLVLSVFLKPKVADDTASLSAYTEGADDINVLPEFLLVQHGESLAAGALARILSKPNQPFTDPNRAMEARGTFERAINSHFARNIKGQHRAPPRSKPHHF